MSLVRIIHEAPVAAGDRMITPIRKPGIAAIYTQRHIFMQTDRFSVIGHGDLLFGK